MVGVTDLRDRYEQVEQAVCAQVPFEISHVPDHEDQRFDARLSQPLRTAPPIARSATAGTPVEIKTCQRVKASTGEPSAWIFHRGPHETLADLDGRYLLAVLDELTVHRWVVCGPQDLVPFLSWYECAATPGYEHQADIRWPLVIGEVSWTPRGRRSRLPDGGESA